MREDEVCEPELQGQIGFEKKKKEHSSQTPNWSKGRDSRSAFQEMRQVAGFAKSRDSRERDQSRRMLGRWFSQMRQDPGVGYFPEYGIGSHRRQVFHAGEGHYQDQNPEKQPGGELHSKTDLESDRRAKEKKERLARLSPEPRPGHGQRGGGPCPRAAAAPSSGAGR